MQKTIIFITVASLLFLSSCDLFNTRDPETPNSSRSSYQTPYDREILLANFKNSLAEKSLLSYVSCFGDSEFVTKKFIYIPAGNSLNSYPVLGSWDVGAENRYYSNLIQQIPSTEKINATFTNEKLTPSADSTLYSAHYIISVVLKKATPASTYEGDMQLTFRQDNRSVWVISMWRDISSGKGLCWSDLKGQFH